MATHTAADNASQRENPLPLLSWDLGGWVVFLTHSSNGTPFIGLQRRAVESGSLKTTNISPTHNSNGGIEGIIGTHTAKRQSGKSPILFRNNKETDKKNNKSNKKTRISLLQTNNTAVHVRCQGTNAPLLSYHDGWAPAD